MTGLTIILLMIAGAVIAVLILSSIVVFFTTGFKRTGRLMGGLYVIVGKPSSGKSYFAASIAVENLVAGRRVFTNFPIVYNDGMKQYVSKYFKKEYLLSQNMTKSCIIVDEAQSEFWSRDFKQFSKQYMMFFSSCAQHEISFYVITQHQDRVDTIINDCANLFAYVEKTEIPFLDMPLRFTITWWNKELELQQSLINDNIEPFLTEHKWFNRQIANSYDTKFFGTDKRPQYEGTDWIAYYKAQKSRENPDGIEYHGNYDFSPTVRLKVFLFKLISKVTGMIDMRKMRIQGEQEQGLRNDRNLEKDVEQIENKIDENLFEDWDIQVKT